MNKNDILTQKANIKRHIKYGQIHFFDFFYIFSFLGTIHTMNAMTYMYFYGVSFLYVDFGC